jgi:hypothetical protein
MDSETTDKGKLIELAIANTEANPSDSEYYQDVAGFKVKIQYRFDIFDLYIKADSEAMKLDASQEITNIVSGLTQLLKDTAGTLQPEYPLFFSNGTRAGVAILDLERRRSIAMSSAKQSSEMRSEIAREYADKGVALTEAEKSELLHEWYEREAEAYEEFKDDE